MSANILKLNEALLLVNKINISSPIEVYYQLEECFGCPLDKLVPWKVSNNEKEAGAEAGGVQDQFVIGTKNNFHLELRQLDDSTTTTNATTKNWCRFDDVALNSYGSYRIDVSSPDTSQAGGQSQHQSLRCVLNTIDSGECLMCPFAILVCLLFAIVAGEQIYLKFWLPNRKRTQYRQADSKLRPSIASTDQPAVLEGGVENGLRASGSNNPIYAGDPDTTGDGASGATRRPKLDTSLCHQKQQTGAEAAAIPAATPATPTVGEGLDESGGGVSQSGKLVQRRIESLDIFRGFTLAGMIFANYGGAGYALLEHKAWDGITLADFVFPFFIFSMGASVAITARGMIRRYRNSFHTLALRIFRRSLILALLGVCLNSKWLDYNRSDGLQKLRLTGVLQRFSISYLIIAFMYTIELTINKWIRAQSLSNVPYLSKLIGIIFELLTAFNYTAIYVYLTFYFNFDPACPRGYIGPGGQTEGGKYANCTGGAAAWLDRHLLGDDHMYNDRTVKGIFKTKVSHDPEGILGYTTSILLTLIGLQCGKILIRRRTHKQRILSLAHWSIALGLASSLIVVIPINKRLWSLTFVTVTALAAFVIMILLYILVDVYSCKQTILIRLLSSAGKNSIFLYVGHSLLFGMLPWWYPIGPQATHLQLLLRLSWSTFMWLWIAHYMAAKKLFIRI